VRRRQALWHLNGIMSRVIRGLRAVFAVAAVVSAAATLVLLTLWLWQQPQGAERANVLALPVGVLALLVAAGFGWKALRHPPSSQEIAGRLMKQVRAERQRFIDQALGVDWGRAAADVTFANPSAGSLPAALEELLVNWQDLDGGRAGSIEDVSNFYQRETSGRLVVLGAPGSGKSVLLSHLVRDLADGLLSMPETDWPVGWRVPITLSLPGCDLGDTGGATQRLLAARLYKWIVERLVEDYQVPDTQARTLVSDERILPVLDGLDEMDIIPADDDPQLAPRLRAAAVIRALNAERTPVVLACRDLEYKGLTVDAGDGETPSKPGLLTDARHVVLQALPTRDVIGFLANRFGGRTQALPDRWQPVVEALKAGEPLLRVLENPWQLFLAVKAYGQETSDPAELVTMTPDQANEQLLVALIPAVTDRDDTAAAKRWTAGDVRRWLTSIADNQARSSRPWRDSVTDISLPELWRVAEQSRELDSVVRELIWEFRKLIRKSIIPIIAATPTLLVSLAFIVVGLGDLLSRTFLYLGLGEGAEFHPRRFRGGFVFVGVLLALLAWGVFRPGANNPRSPIARFDLGVLRTSAGRRTYLRNLVSAALRGVILGFALATVFVLGSWAWSVSRPPDRLSRLESVLESALRHDQGWPYWLMNWLMNWLESVLLPRLESVLLPALVFGLAASVIPGLIEGLRGGLEIAPSPSVLARQCIRYHMAYGLATALVFGVGTGLWAGQRLGLAPGLALGLATGLALGLGFALAFGGSGWLRYAIGVSAAVRQQLLPRRPARFLDWCLGAGLMRMAGSSLQFRHRQLQDWLTSPGERAKQAEWQAQWSQSEERYWSPV
jgi:hypothetical protein